MKRIRPRLPRVRRLRGVAAVEFALLAILLMTMLSAPLYIGRVLWHYTAIQKAAHDAARYLATVPEAEMRSGTLATRAAEFANVIVNAELAELTPYGIAPVVTLECNGTTCAGVTAWSRVRVYIELEIRDPMFRSPLAGRNGKVINASVEMRYMGTK